MHLKNYALRKVKSINNLGWSTSVSWRKNEYLRLCGQANALLSCYHLSMEIAHRVRDVSCACFRHLSVSDDCTPVSLPAPFQFWMLHQHWFSFGSLGDGKDILHPLYMMLYISYRGQSLCPIWALYSWVGLGRAVASSLSLGFPLASCSIARQVLIGLSLGWSGNR